MAGNKKNKRLAKRAQKLENKALHKEGMALYFSGKGDKSGAMRAEKKADKKMAKAQKLRSKMNGEGFKGAYGGK